MERKPEINIYSYQIDFVKPEQLNLVKGAVDLINHFNCMNLMLGTTVEHYLKIASKNSLVVAKNTIGEVVGTAAYTQYYKDDIWEFGGWAVSEEFQHKGVGIKVIKKLFTENPHFKTIAFGNKNSGPLFESFGAEIIKDHSVLPEEAFELCNNCPNKPNIGCCDTIYNLAPIIENLANTK